MKNQSSENKLVITEEFIFDQNKLSKDPNNHFKWPIMARIVYWVYTVRRRTASPLCICLFDLILYVPSTIFQ